MTNLNAEVVSVLPNKIKIRIKDLEDFRIAEERLTVGSYVKVSDMEECFIIAIIDNFIIEKDVTDIDRTYILEAVPIGFVDNNGVFTRGGTRLPYHHQELNQLLEVTSRIFMIKLNYQKDSYFPN